VTEPIWWRDAGLPVWSAIEGPHTEEVVIVGAGLAGLGLARALRERGVDALVIDAAGPGAGASGRNAGFVLRTHVTDYPALRARIGAEIAQKLIALARDNHERIASLLPSTALAHRSSGSVMLASGAAEMAVLTEAQLLLGADGVRTREVKVPSGLRGFDAALRIEDDGEVHPGRIVAALAKQVRGRRGVAIELEDGAVVGDGFRIASKTIVLATNAWTGLLVPELARVITPQRAQMLATAPVSTTLETPCYAGLGFDYFRQRADGRVLLGGRRHRFLAEEATDEDAITDGVQSALEAYLHEHLPFAASAPIEARWSGIMAFTADGLPLAGPLPTRAGAWVLAGWTGHGLGLSLAVADRLAERIVAGTSGDTLMQALAPKRFG
jgi:gamma-glutamylputrescine oxidase